MRFLDFMHGHVDGNLKNDWITDQDAQRDICTMIDDAIAYLETLLYAPYERNDNLFLFFCSSLIENTGSLRFLSLFHSRFGLLNYDLLSA